MKLKKWWWGRLTLPGSYCDAVVEETYSPLLRWTPCQNVTSQQGGQINGQLPGPLVRFPQGFWPVASEVPGQLQAHTPTNASYHTHTTTCQMLGLPSSAGTQFHKASGLEGPTHLASSICAPQLPGRYGWPLLGAQTLWRRSVALVTLNIFCASPWPPYLPRNSPHLAAGGGGGAQSLFSNAHLFLRSIFLSFLRFLLWFILCFLVIQVQDWLELPQSLYLLNIKDASSQMVLWILSQYQVMFLFPFCNLIRTEICFQ